MSATKKLSRFAATPDRTVTAGRTFRSGTRIQSVKAGAA